MYTTYRMNSSDLDVNFLEAVKKLFASKEIEITVAEMDETAYLLRSDNNRQRLLQAVANVDGNRNLREVRLDATA